MIIELIILFLFIIDAIKKREDTKKRADHKVSQVERIDIERILRSQLRLLTRSMFSEVDLDSVYLLKDFLFHAEEHDTNRQILTEIERGVGEEVGTSAINESLISAAKFELSILMSLAPTSSLLSDRLDDDYLKLIAESSVEVPKVAEHAINVVRWINMFDKHTYSQNLFKS